VRYQESLELLSGQGSYERQIPQLLQFLLPRTVIVDGSSSLLPIKLGLLPSASFSREMWPLMPSSQVQVKGTSVAQQVWRHYRQNLKRATTLST